MSNEELYHHGILGMKWGVRRYQNADGSYTQEGLKRYRKSEENYNNARSNYQRAKESGDKQAVRTARADVKTAKRYLSQDYDQLKRDISADRGKKLYEKGMSLDTLNDKQNAILKSGIEASALAAAIGAVDKFNRQQVFGNSKTESTYSIYGELANTYAIGRIAATGALALSYNRRIDDLTEYFKRNNIPIK